MDAAILAHGKFPNGAKTATGVMRYGDHDIVAILDRDKAGTRVHDHAPGLPDAPIVEDMESVGEADTLIIGIAPVGGEFDDSWRSDIKTALEHGCEVISGLHQYLSDDEEFVQLADEHGGTLTDVRQPSDDLSVADGVADRVDATVIETVGTDCSTGKMTTTWELVEALEQAGYDAAPIPTGQTGIIVDGWGEPVDAVVADYIAGAVERMILERGDDHDFLIVEGQGSLFHPAYSGVTCGMLHGAMPDALILCHAADRERINKFERFGIPRLSDCVELYEDVAAPVHEASVVGMSMNTADLEETAYAEAYLRTVEAEVGVPATDVIRMGAEPLVDEIT